MLGLTIHELVINVFPRLICGAVPKSQTSRTNQKTLAMKQLFRLTAILMVMSFAMNAQAQTFGLKAGLNLASMVIKVDDEKADDIKTKPGFHIGVTYEMPFGDMLAFEPGLLLSTKGYKMDGNPDDFVFNLMYVEIPLNAKAYFDLGELKLFAIAGPYIGIGITGKSKLGDDSEDVEWGTDTGEANRIDFGVNIGAGVQIGAIEAGIGYGLGLGNMSNADDVSFKHRVFGVSVAYKLGMN